MQLSELIARYRVLANDKVEPYFVSDDEVTAFLNDAVNEAAIRGRLIYDATTKSVCIIKTKIGEPVYRLHPSLYEIAHASFHPANGSQPQTLRLISVEEMDSTMPTDWRHRAGAPTKLVQEDRWFRLAPVPDTEGEVKLEGYRVPVNPMEDTEDEPEISQLHHQHLIQWVLHRVFGIPDGEIFDPARSEQALQEFERYFGLRPDSDLRRITREDVPHHVTAFWP